MQPQIIDNAIYHTTYEDYGKGWLVDGEKTFEQLREDAIKLEYLEKCYKSKRRGQIQQMEQMMNPNLAAHNSEVNEKYNMIKMQLLQKNFLSKLMIFIILMKDMKNQKVYILLLMKLMVK